MKDSGIEWIGQIPEDWKVARMERGLEEIVRRNNPIRVENILSLTKDKGVIPYEDKGNQGNKSKTDLADYKIAYENTIVMNSMNVIIGSVGLSNYRGCVSPVYYVFKAKDNNDIRFFNYICQLPAFQSELKKYANGILEIRLRVSSYNVLKRNIPFPSYDEQKKISDKLDIEVRYIDGIKLKITQQIETLEDYKKSVITEAVTKGLDKNVEMKDSGIEWIGEIPKHWEIKRLKQILSNNSLRVGPFGSALKSSDIVDSGKWVYNQRTVLDNNFDTNDTFIDDSKFNELISFKVNAGDILLTTRGTIGRIAIVPKNFYEGVIHPCIIKFRVKEGIFKNALIKYIFNSTDIVLKQVEYLSNSTTIGVIYSYNLVNIYFPTPPVNEQLEIINYLDKKTATIDEAITAKQKQLEILEEYKKSLIYEYVTGKKEVGDVETI